MRASGRCRVSPRWQLWVYTQRFYCLLIPNMAAGHINCEEARIVLVQVLRGGKRVNLSQNQNGGVCMCKKKKKLSDWCLKAHARNNKSMSANHTAMDLLVGRGGRGLTIEYFLETNSNSPPSDLISYPFCHSAHWLAPVLSASATLLSKAPSSISIALLPFVRPIHSSHLFLFLIYSFSFFEWWNLGFLRQQALSVWVCVCLFLGGQGGASSSLIHTNVHW